MVVAPVGRAVASDTRDELLENSHRHTLFTVIVIEKTKIKEKRPVIAQVLLSCPPIFPLTWENPLK